MRQIKIADTTLCNEKNALSFKEKLEIARKLERLSVDTIEMPEIGQEQADTLLVRTISSFVKNACLSVCASKSTQSVENAAAALRNAERKRIRIELPVTAAIMEYSLHLKQDKMCAYIDKMVKAAKEECDDVEFCAVDATRAEKEFLKSAVSAAVEAGATCVTLCDSACVLLPDDFAAFVKEFCDEFSVPIGVKCSDKKSLAVAAGVLSVKNGAVCVKTSVSGDAAPLRGFCAMIESFKENYDMSFGIISTELNRVIDQIEWIMKSDSSEKISAVSYEDPTKVITLDINDTKETVSDNITQLGYDLSSEDIDKVYEEFRRIARKKKVTPKELDAIVASTALQGPAAYTLESYVINSGNIITSTAQIKLIRDGKSISGIASGDGPIDASFRALEQIMGKRVELDDFSIHTVTGEKEAMGSALVRLRHGGKIYSGTGLSTDIISASIRAYINAVNKIVYEEG